MDQTHIHLLITHLPIFGSILGAIVLGYGLWKRSPQTLNASYLLLIISSVGGGIAYQTGEAAEEAAETLQGVLKHSIHEHEEAGELAIIFIIALGVLALISLVLSWRHSTLTYTAAWITLAAALLTFALTARTGYLGGQIRHTEITSNVPDPKHDPAIDLAFFHPVEHLVDVFQSCDMNGGFDLAFDGELYRFLHILAGPHDGSADGIPV